MIFISQPTFFPWIGYFDIIDQVDIFIILDDVDFSKQSWHQRNRFKTSQKLEWFTVPVKAGKGKLISEIEIFNGQRLFKKFKNFIETNYSKSRYFKTYSKDLFSVFEIAANGGKLVELNTQVIKFFLKQLKINTKIILSSSLKINEDRSKKIVNICNHLNINKYLSSYGAKDYLEEDKKIFTDKKINTFLHNYKHPEYKQLYPPFLSNACILDLVFNEGENSLEIIKKGRQHNIPLF